MYVKIQSLHMRSTVSTATLISTSSSNVQCCALHVHVCYIRTSKQRPWVTKPALRYWNCSVSYYVCALSLRCCWWFTKVHVIGLQFHNTVRYPLAKCTTLDVSHTNVVILGPTWHHICSDISATGCQGISIIKEASNLQPRTFVHNLISSTCICTLCTYCTRTRMYTIMGKHLDWRRYPY